MIFGSGMLHVEWYSSITEMMNGLRKNTFSAVEYYTVLQIFLVIPQLLFNVLPFAAVWFTSGWTFIFNLITVFILFLAYAEAAKFSNTNKFWGFIFPVTTLLFIYIQMRSMIYTLVNDGIAWQGTHYPLKDLRKNRFM